MAKSTSKNAGPKGAAPKKAAPKKAAAAPAKKVAAKKAAPAKNVAPAKKAAAKKAAIPAKKAVAKKAIPAPKAAAKKVFMSDETMLDKLFLDSLKDIYYAEKALTKALPKLRKAATSPELQQAFEQHALVTEQQIQRLEQVFQTLGKKAQGKKCEAMEGLTKEADSIVSETKKGSKTRDVGIIMAAQKVEHYEIATYGSLATLAAMMGQNEIKELLGQTLQEEKDADSLLSQLAQSNINVQAEQEGGEPETKSEEEEGEDDEPQEDGGIKSE